MFRFAILTKLVVFFMLALSGTATHAAFQQEGQQEAIDRLKTIGASVSLDDQGRVIALQFPEGVGFGQKDWPLLEQLPDLRDLDLGAIWVNNDILKHVGKLTELRSLNLFGNPIEDAGLTQIEGLQKLETLYLYRTFLDDQALESVVKLKSLRRLNMLDTFLSDKGLKLLGTCKQLKHLSIGNSKAGSFPESFFSPEGIEQLRKDLPNTEISYWGGSDRLDVPEKLNKPAKKAFQKTRVLNVKVAAAPQLSKREGSDWPCFLGPDRDGTSRETGVNVQWNQSLPKLLWHHKVGTGHAAPTIVKGRLLLYHRLPSPQSPAEFVERLSCFHSETGEPLWQVDFPTDYKDPNGYGDGPRSSPVVDNDRIFLLGPSGVVRCLQLVDGKTIWDLDLVESFGCALPTYGMGASPVVLGDLILLTAGASKSNEQAKTVIALDKTNGVFRFGVGDHPASYATPVITEQFGRRWCFVFNQDGLFSFNPDNQKIDFEFPWRANISGCVNAACPVVSGDQVFITEAYKPGGAMLRFGQGDPGVVWQDSKLVRDRIMACHWNTPILKQGLLYGCSGRHRNAGLLKCVDWATGETRWKFQLDGRSSLTYIDGYFVNQSESGLLTLFQATDSGYVEAGRLDQRNAEVMPSYPAWNAPVIAKRIMYLRGKHELIAYDLSLQQEDESTSPDLSEPKN